MKFQLTGTDLLENHHIYGLIQEFFMRNERQPSYIILHPETSYRIQAEISQHQELSYTVIQYDYQKERPNITLYGITLLRTYDVEEGFIELI